MEIEFTSLWPVFPRFAALNCQREAKEVFNHRRCLQDEVTQELCKMFQSEELFSSECCLAIIQSIASVMETDIGAIERQHTISRKVIMARSTARPVTLQTLSADFFLRQYTQRTTDSCSFNYIDGESVRSKLRKAQNRPKKIIKKKPKRGGGGAFRAFLSMTTKGSKASGSSWSGLRSLDRRR